MKEFLLFCLLVLSAFFSSSETAFFAYKGNRLLKIEGRAKKLLGSPLRLLSFILLGNNLVNVAFSALGTVVILNTWGESGLTIGTIVLAALVLTFGEILPKTLAASLYRKFVPIYSAPLYYLYRALAPVSSLFYHLAQRNLSFLFGEKQEKSPTLTEKELQFLVEEAMKEGLFLPEERGIMGGIVQLEEKTAGEIMQPRPKILALPLESKPSQAIEVFQKYGISRLPLYRSSLDNIVGVLYAKDLIQKTLLKDVPALQEIMRPPIFVPEGITLNRLLVEFRKRQAHIAVVVDEYGGTTGIVTLEDILEEIVGEIWDEYDQVMSRVRQIGPDVFLLSSDTEREELKELGIEIPEEYGNLSSFLIDLSGRIPQKGEKILYGDWEFTITSSKPNKIETVRVARCSN